MAQGNYKLNESITVTYQAAGGTTGLSDVTMQIYDESGALDGVNFPDVTMTEVGSSGRYEGSFTPDAVGVWRVVINSTTKPGQVVKQFDVVSHNIDSIGGAVGGLNDVSAADVNAEVDTALADYDVAKASDITSPPMLG